jgi:hypothetical protein
MTKRAPVALLFLLGLALLCGWCYSLFRPTFEFDAGSGGIGAVSGGAFELLFVIALLALVVIGLWTVARWICERVTRRPPSSA